MKINMGEKNKEKVFFYATRGFMQKIILVLENLEIKKRFTACSYLLCGFSM